MILCLSIFLVLTVAEAIVAYRQYTKMKKLLEAGAAVSMVFKMNVRNRYERIVNYLVIKLSDFRNSILFLVLIAFILIINWAIAMVATALTYMVITFIK